MATSGTFQFQVADWSRRGDGWARAGVVVIERNRDGGWGTTDVSGNWSEHACPDAAREAADAYLVAQGRLNKSRAFVRLGEWEEDGVSYYRTKGGTPWHHAYMVAKKAEVDAELVASGALDPSRAFKVPTLAECVTVGPTGATGAPLAEWVPAVEAVFRKFSSHAINQPAKPAWGEWERRTIHGGKESCEVFLRASSVADSDLLFAKATAWGHGSITHPATDIDDAREKADAYLVARGELEAGRAFKRVGDWVFFAPGVQSRHRRADWCAAVVGDSWGVWGTAYLSNGVANGNDTGDAGKAAADAELVRRGLLAEERAFKAAKPSAVYVQRIFLPGSTESFTVESNGARPFYVERSPDGQTRVTDWGGASYAVGPGDALTYTITDGVGRFAKKAAGVSLAQWAVGPVPPTRTIAPGPEETVTLANWEHHLPALLSGAPREFRDGFNRRQGPAWEAYLVALAGVKERIQIQRPHLPLRGVVFFAADRARTALGPEWVKANVREPLPRWEAVSDSRMGHR